MSQMRSTRSLDDQILVYVDRFLERKIAA